MIITVASHKITAEESDGVQWVTLLAMLSPDLLLLQQADALRTDTDLRRAVERELRMPLLTGQARHGCTAVAWNANRLNPTTVDSAHARHMTHGYTVLTCTTAERRGKPPLTAASVHLNPSSASQAVGDVQVLTDLSALPRGLGIAAGDMAYVPLGDPEPDWTLMNPGKRLARAQPTTSPQQWAADRRVGQAWHAAGYIDVCAHVADREHNPTLRTQPGSRSGTRTYQAHVARALEPAIVDFRWLARHPGEGPGLVFRLDLRRAHPHQPSHTQAPAGTTAPTSQHHPHP